jgi:hypothetical protein
MVNVTYPIGTWIVHYEDEPNDICRFVYYPGASVSCQITEELCEKEKCPIRVKSI